MRILHVSTRLILGGSQENTVLSCEGQARLGHEVHLAFGPIYGPEGSLLERVEAFNERCRRGEERTSHGDVCEPIVTHVVPDMVREVSPRRDLRCYWQMRGLIAKLRLDVVHTHSSKAGIIGRAAAWAERARGVRGEAGLAGGMRIVHTIHGPPFMPVEGGLVKRMKRRVMNGVYTWAERVAARRCDVIVSVADAMTEQFLARGIGRRGMYETVYSGMETERFLNAAAGEDRASMRAELGLRDELFVVGTVARLAEHKGHDDLIDAVALMRREAGARGVDVSKLVLLWVGDGWWRTRLLARLRSGAEPFNVIEVDREDVTQAWARVAEEERVKGARPTVVIRGLVPPGKVAGLVRAMDVLAHPSYREGLPRTVPQGLLCGVSVVAYDCDGTGEVCVEGETGKLVKTGDVAGLGRAIMELWGDAGLRARLAERGRAVCAERFSTQRMVEHLERVYTRTGQPLAGGAK